VKVSPGPSVTGLAQASSPITLAAVVTEAQARLQAAGADAPRLTALVLLEHATCIPRETVLAHPERTLAPAQLADFHAVLQRRAQREPLAYIVGTREFYGLPFRVNANTLIPRPETEGMIDLALDWLRSQPSPMRWGVDVGTGSGAIALSLLRSFPPLRMIATDVSIAALRTAHQNAGQLQVADRVQFVACNLADGVSGRVPLVLANLPYIASAEIDDLQPEVSRYEPRSALDGGPDGMAAILALLERLPGLLELPGVAVLEIGDTQGAQLATAAQRALPESHVRIAPDSTGRNRFLLIER
jgi:release factor glutamine methyltransferase